MEFVAGGAQADVYKKDGIAVKLFKKEISREAIIYEMTLQKNAFALGLPVPEIFDLVEIDGRPGISMEYLEGVSMGEAAELFITRYCEITKVSKENILCWAPVAAAARLTEGRGADENKKLLKIVREHL